MTFSGVSIVGFCVLETARGAAAVAHLLATTDISDISLSDRPMMTLEKQAACGLATPEEILVLRNKIEHLH